MNYIGEKMSQKEIKELKIEELKEEARDDR